MVPYSNPFCGCSPEADFPIYGGCCIAAGPILWDMFDETLFMTMFKYTKSPPAKSFHQDYYIDTLHKDINKFLKKTSDTHLDVLVSEMVAMLSFFDAQNLMLANITMQRTQIQTQRDYNPSEQICRFGTLSRSVASSEERGKPVAVSMATQAVSRQMLKAGTAGGSSSGAGTTIGRSADTKARWGQFLGKFCQPSDFNRAISACTGAGGDKQINRDIDMTRTLDAPLTLDLDYSAAGTPDSENLSALMSNLYASNLVTNLTKSDLEAIAKQKFSSEATQNSLRKFFDYRALVAKRSVAENSFAAIAALKAKGDKSSTDYMKAVLKQLGLTDKDDLDRYLGVPPSYYTQMEILTKKLYQDPAFYANLMDSPANVGRQQVAMSGIELAQDRDIYESLRRSEMLLSTLLEVYVQGEQDMYIDRGRK